MRRICVYCGSSSGKDPAFARAAAELGRALARRGLGLVYGGGGVGLMKVVADAALEAGAEVTGVIPRFLADREVAHPGLRDLRVVETLHERKALMEKLSFAFVALPGGLGTLDELCEIATWGQLGLHRKPLGLLNISGYFGKFLSFLDSAVERGFLQPGSLARLAVAEEIEPLLDRLVGSR